MLKAQRLLVEMTMLNTDVNSAGVGFGAKFTYEGFALVAAGFHGNALGIRGQRTQGADTTAAHALDDVVKKENLMVDIFKVLIDLVKALT